MLRIAVYGKGGIGKSTTVSNLAGALATEGLTVMQIGCDPKADSTRLLMGGERIPTVLDMMREKDDDVELSDIVFEAANGVLCVEAGGPLPGIGCAGRGIITAFELLESLDAYGEYEPDAILYDVLGDVVCGGFAMPLRSKYAQHVLIVSSGEMMALYAASNIKRALDNFRTRNYAELAGLVANKRGVEDEDAILERFSREEGVPIVAEIPRSHEIQEADKEGALALERFPDSEAASSYRELARYVMGLEA